MDMDKYSSARDEDVYETFNILMRRKPKVNFIYELIFNIRHTLTSFLYYNYYKHY
jgi:hypothetical protein